MDDISAVAEDDLLSAIFEDSAECETQPDNVPAAECVAQLEPERQEGSSEESPSEELLPGGVDDIEQVESLTSPLGWYVPVDWQAFGSRLRLDPQTESAVWVVVLTIPDESLCSRPVLVTTEFKAVDLSLLDRMSGAEIKALITETLPDDQLELLREWSAEKPKKIVTDAIRVELVRRSALECSLCGQPVESFSAWLQSAARDPLRCRIVAAAIAIGGGEPECRAVSEEQSECELLDWIWSFLDGSKDVGCEDFSWLSSVLGIRSIALDCEARRTNMVFPIHRPAGGRMADSLKAFGLAERFPVPGQGLVLSLSVDHKSDRLADVAGQRLDAERAFVLAMRTVF